MTILQRPPTLINLTIDDVKKFGVDNVADKDAEGMHEDFGDADILGLHLAAAEKQKKGKVVKRNLSLSVSPVSRKRTHVLPPAELHEVEADAKPKGQNPKQLTKPAVRAVRAGPALPVRGMDRIEAETRARESRSVAERVGASASTHSTTTTSNTTTSTTTRATTVSAAAARRITRASGARI